MNRTRKNGPMFKSLIVIRYFQIDVQVIITIWAYSERKIIGNSFTAVYPTSSKKNLNIDVYKKKINI